jgi:hypothetical protein
VPPFLMALYFYSSRLCVFVFLSSSATHARHAWDYDGLSAGEGDFVAGGDVVGAVEALVGFERIAVGA